VRTMELRSCIATILLACAQPAWALRMPLADGKRASLRPAFGRRAALLGAAVQLGSLTQSAAADDISASLKAAERQAEARARVDAVDEKMKRAREDARAARAELAAAERAAAEIGDKTEAERKRAKADALDAAERIDASEASLKAELLAAEKSAAARRRADREAVLERANQNTLRAPPVLFRARADMLVDPADARDCAALENLLRADESALYELLPAARQYVRFTELTDNNLDKGAKSLLKRMLEDADISQERISRQLEGIRTERKKRFCPDMR